MFQPDFLIMASKQMHKSIHMINEKADLKCSISVTQRQIDMEADIRFNVNGRSMNLKLPNIAEEGTLLRLPGEGQHGGDLYVEINIKETGNSFIGEFLEKKLLTGEGNPPASKVRMRAIWGMLFSLMLLGVFLTGLFLTFPMEQTHFYGYGWGLALLPFLVFFVEFITGKRFDFSATKWDALKGWQKGIAGTLIVLISTALIILICGLIVKIYLK